MGAEYIDLDEAERVEARFARSSRDPYCDAYSHAETATVWPEPTPLVRPLQPPKEFPVEALGPVMGNATRGIADIVRCPLPIAGCSVLAAASLAAQAHVDVVHPAIGRRVPTSLFFLTIAESGERKSAADHEALEAVRKHEELAAQRYKLDYASWRDRHEAWEAARTTAKRKAKANSWQSVHLELQALGEEPKPPARGGWLPRRARHAR